MQLYRMAVAFPIVGLCFIAESAEAQDIEVTVVPRFQYLYIVPEEDADEQDNFLPNYGASAFITAPNSDWGVSFTGFVGDGSGKFEIDGFTGDWNVTRIDLSAFAEYQPPGSSVALLLGVRYLDIDASSSFDGIVDSRQDTDREFIVAEGGLRFAATLGSGSNHVFTGHFTLGVGHGEIKIDSDVNSTYQEALDIKSSGIGITGEFAAGYSYFITPEASIGARIRFVGASVLVDEEETLAYGIGPEINFSYRF